VTVVSSLGKVFVAVENEKVSFIFNESCIYVHIWLWKTWHNLFSFAQTCPKAKVFCTSTSNWVWALSYTLAGCTNMMESIHCKCI